MANAASQTLKKTPLHALHVELGAKMVPFGGYDMPVQYREGILAEHRHTRTAAGLFDVSHMGQVRLVGADAAEMLETLVPVDIVDLPVFKQRYALFTNEAGGILDDLMVCRRPDDLFVVVNAGCKEQDIAHLQKHLGERVIPCPERALLALQGPQAVTALARLAPGVERLTFMDGGFFKLGPFEVFLTRSGYTGEDGFEISIHERDAVAVAQLLLDQHEVKPIGLGARDTLRLEAGLCLYGHDINTETTPAEAALTWAIQKVRRSGGARAGGYPGFDVIDPQLPNTQHASPNPATRKRIGLSSTEKLPVREGAKLVDATGNEIGVVTSGTLGPTVGHLVAMGYVNSAQAALGTNLFALVRDKKVAMTVSAMPFAPHRYFRG
jgi:aminomethyltransferase